MTLLSATDSWLDALDKKSYVGALLIDLSKAFDTVPHLLLLSELMNIGCNSDVIAWFRNYLTDRFQRVVTHDEITQWLLVSRGFPQFKALASVLFCSISMSENSHRNVFLIHFSLLMIPRTGCSTFFSWGCDLNTHCQLQCYQGILPVTRTYN